MVHYNQKDIQMTKKHMKRCSISLIIKEMQIKTTMRHHFTQFRMAIIRDFPGGPVVKNLPSNAGDASSIPGRGTKIPHAAGQLSPLTTTTELTHLN